MFFIARDKLVSEVGYLCLIRQQIMVILFCQLVFEISNTIFLSFKVARNCMEPRSRTVTVALCMVIFFL